MPIHQLHSRGAFLGNTAGVRGRSPAAAVAYLTGSVRHDPNAAPAHASAAAQAALGRDIERGSMGRSSRSAAAAAAYTTGQLREDGAGVTYDYRRKGGVALDGFSLPAGVALPVGREDFWTWLEGREFALLQHRYRKSEEQFAEAWGNATWAGTQRYSLPNDISVEQARELVERFVAERFTKHGLVTEWAIHDEPGNLHCHLVHTLRPITAGQPMPEGLERSPVRRFAHGLGIGTAKADPFGSASSLSDWARGNREWLAEEGNILLAGRGSELRVEHRSFEARALELQPMNSEPHPTAVRALERSGEEILSVDRNRLAREANAERVAADADQALKAVFANRATATEADIKAELFRLTQGDEERFGTAWSNIEASGLLVSVGHDARGRVRFATAEFVAIEREMIDAATVMRDRVSVRTDVAVVERLIADREAAKGFRFSDEQRAAIRHMAGDGDLKALVGVPGAGKTTLIEVVCRAHEQAGARVRGFATAGAAADALGRETGISAQTIASYRVARQAATTWQDYAAGGAITGEAQRFIARALQAEMRRRRRDDLAEQLEAGGIDAVREADQGFAAAVAAREIERLAPMLMRAGDVIVVDEAGMVGTRDWRMLVADARDAGAKIVALGDPQQFQAVDAGSAYRAILDVVGAARVTEIRRQKIDWQAKASAAMVEDRFAEGLAAYHRGDRLAMADKRAGARAELVRQYLADRGEFPGGGQLALAYERADVAALNAAIRTALVEQGEIQPAGVPVAGKDFGVGDRVVFTANERGQAVRNVDVAPQARLHKPGDFSSAWLQEQARRRQDWERYQDARQRMRGLAYKLSRRGSWTRSVALVVIDSYYGRQREQLKAAQAERWTAAKAALEAEHKAYRAALAERQAAAGGEGVKNGTFGVVVAAANGVMQVRIDPVDGAKEGRLVEFRATDYPHIDHGYAVTMHKSQGQTIDRVYVQASKYMCADATLVAMTRHRLDCRLYGDRETFADENAMIRSVGRQPTKDNVRDYVVDPAEQKARSEVEKFRQLSDGWKARLKARAEVAATKPVEPEGDDKVELARYRDSLVEWRERMAHAQARIDQAAEVRGRVADMLEQDFTRYHHALRFYGVSRDQLLQAAGRLERIRSAAEEAGLEQLKRLDALATTSRTMWNEIKATHPGARARQHPRYGEFNAARRERDMLAVDVVAMPIPNRRLAGELQMSWRAIENWAKRGLVERQLAELSPEDLARVQRIDGYVEARRMAGEIYGAIMADAGIDYATSSEKDKLAARLAAPKDPRYEDYNEARRERNRLVLEIAGDAEGHARFLAAAGVPAKQFEADLKSARDNVRVAEQRAVPAGVPAPPAVAAATGGGVGQAGRETAAVVAAAPPPVPPVEPLPADPVRAGRVASYVRTRVQAIELSAAMTRELGLAGVNWAKPADPATQAARQRLGAHPRYRDYVAAGRERNRLALEIQGDRDAHLPFLRRAAGLKAEDFAADVRTAEAAVKVTAAPASPPAPAPRRDEKAEERARIAADALREAERYRQRRDDASRTPAARVGSGMAYYSALCEAAKSGGKVSADMLDQAAAEVLAMRAKGIQDGDIDPRDPGIEVWLRRTDLEAAEERPGVVARMQRLLGRGPDWS